jgi:hypothetical protein
MTCWVDADHASCQMTHQSQTGLVIYVNAVPIIWFSRRQNTLESAIFGAEFIALKTAIRNIDALHYRLCMFF